MHDWTYDILDHKWENFKRWLEACEKRFGIEGPITVRNIKRMVETLDRMEKTTDDVIIKAFFDV